MPLAPCNCTTSTPPKLVVMLAPNHSTLQWHPAMAPRPLNHSTLQWHPAMAPSNGTTSTQPKLVVTLPPTIPHYNGTLRWHPAMAPRPLPQSWSSTPPPRHPAMAPWCHVQSAKVVRRPPPLLEVRTPIAIAIWGKITYSNNCQRFFREAPSWSMEFYFCWNAPFIPRNSNCGSYLRACAGGVFVGDACWGGKGDRIMIEFNGGR